MKNTPVITIKLHLDTTEFKEKLNEISKMLDDVKAKHDVIEPGTINNNITYNSPTAQAPSEKNRVMQNASIGAVFQAAIEFEKSLVGIKKIVGSNDYKVFTKDDYMRYRLSGEKACNISEEYIKRIKQHWERLSKGYNFIIGVGQEDHLMFYSAMKFNNDVLENK